jgi:hypothetical protein
MIRMDAKNKRIRGANSIIIENTSGPGERTAEKNERITSVSLHFAKRKLELTIPTRPSKIKTTGSSKLRPKIKWILKNTS